MNKINRVGEELIQYKVELQKDYPQIVKNSMYIALDKLLEAKVLDLDTAYIVKDNSTDIATLTEYLLTKKAYTKTEEEIFRELEALRGVLDNKLVDAGLGYGIVTSSEVEREIIRVGKKYCLDEQFAMDYFGVSEVDVAPLMKRKGFMEKFAVLRLTKIFDDFMSQLSYPEELIKCDVDLVFFDEDKGAYSIEFYIEIGVLQAEDNEMLTRACAEIKNIFDLLDEFYRVKTVV